MGLSDACLLSVFHAKDTSLPLFLYLLHTFPTLGGWTRTAKKDTILLRQPQKAQLTDDL